eukprot:Blabericola_migrator_1__9520@NODE_517_length_7921_cov_221_621976_g395_i0_p6_GENE_NODE_517_length_7921_cov_221_621976_g395_i0NODE_517_length_7921_cov_221_621976_g395_i0_p6_ORF_typecomplete_len195_score29_75PITH/PF06201_13/1_6e27_NODE_517_length_7921_cov_221_621976_g395_i020602644
MNINREAANTRRMREHQLTKRQGNAVAHEEVDLGVATSVIDYTTSTLLNAKPDSGNVQSVTQGIGKAVVSDADEQLIVKIMFKDPCTITAVIVEAKSPPEPSSEDESMSGPKTLNFYSNKDDLDFWEVQEIPAAQVADIPQGEAKVVLKGNKFQRVNSVQIFAADNQNGTPLTFINRLSLRGFVCPPYTQQHML